MASEQEYFLGADDLVKLVHEYEPSAPKDLIVSAYEFASKHHEGQVRSSGEPYFTHPLEVARIAASWRLDHQSVITALLHDIVEDTDNSIQEIEKRFGSEIAKLVDGVTKLNSLELSSIASEKSEQAENLRKLILAMSADVRVLLVKLMDRLHNMRTIHYLKSPTKIRLKAIETQEIFAPLAQRIGMQGVYDELSNICFQVLHPEIFHAIERRKQQLFSKDMTLVSRISQEIQSVLSLNGIESQVSGREKATYSIWHKMQTKNLPFEQLSDIFAYRVLTNTISECYQALGLLHSTYPVVPGRFKDYISTPKANSYQSLHTCLIGPFGCQIEVQIRTYSMHDVNERGLAAHWSYKQNKKDHEDLYIFKWLRELVEILDSAHNPEEFLEHTKMEIYQEQVFCFTPAGEIITLPQGATPVDFAYAIHSDVGNACVGCRVNGRMMPLRVELKNGDQVQILTSKNQLPSPTWERFVVTGRAKSAIRKSIREKQKQEYVLLGKSLYKQHIKIDLQESELKQLATTLKCPTPADLYNNLGLGLVSLMDLQKAANNLFKTDSGKQEKQLTEADFVQKPAPSAEKSGSTLIQGLIPGMAIHYAKCCHPMPGDRIVGIIFTGKGITIHKSDCINLEQFKGSMEKWIDVDWGDDDQYKDALFEASMRVVVENKAGVLATVASVASKLRVNINNLKVIKRDIECTDMTVEVQVSSLEQFNRFLIALNNEPEIMFVERQ